VKKLISYLKAGELDKANAISFLKKLDDLGQLADKDTGFPGQ
jgi:hypothetical protein